jgi:hypothetical protein
MGELASTVDPTGRRVALTIEAWSHITEQHAPLADHLNDVMRAVARPDFVTPDPEPGRQRYWRHSLGPSRWLAVVVDFGPDPALVVAAFPDATDPPGWPSGLTA